MRGWMDGGKKRDERNISKDSTFLWGVRGYPKTDYVSGEFSRCGKICCALINSRSVGNKAPHIIEFITENDLDLVITQ